MTARVAVPPVSEAKATGVNVAIFAEDRIRPLPNLTVTVGLRVDREQIDSPGFEPLDLSGEAELLFEQVNPLLMAGADENVVALTVRQTIPQVFTAYEDVETFTLELAEMMGIPANQASTGLNSYTTQSVSWSARRRPENISITNINPAPFLGVAWDPFKTGKTKIAATAGRHYDKIFLAVPLIEMEPVTTDLSFRAWWWRGNWYVIEPCTAWTACFNPAVNTRVVDRDLRTPYQDEFTLSFERELVPETTLRLLYVHRNFEDQLQDVDVNHLPGDFGHCGVREGGHAVMIPSPGEGQTVTDVWSGESYTDTDPGIGDGRTDDCVGSRLPGVSNTQGPDGIADLYIQNPAWGEFFVVGNFNTTEYEAFVVELTRRQYRNWQMNTSYTWSKAEGDAEDFSQALGDDPTLLDDERGFLAYDQRHVFKFNATTIVPWAGGFRFGGAVQWQSGLPYSILNLTTVRDAMPPYLGDVGVEPRNRLRYETGQRNSERNESWWNVDLHLAKEFRVKSQVEMQVSLDVFNLLNDNSLRVSESVKGTYSAVRRFGRQFQLGLRVAF
jgi:hypothetical protein